MSRWLLMFAALLLAFSLAASAEEATIHVDAARALGPVNRRVLGQNIEAADSYHIFTPTHNFLTGCTAEGIWDPKARQPVPQTVQFARDVGLSALRYPGGCLVHNFNWRDAVGPLESRPHFQFGPAEFMAYCRAVGAEPVITVSDYVGGPQDAADLVEYLNAPASPEHPWAAKRAEWGHPEPFGATIFEIGNESDHGNHDVEPRRKLTPEQYVELFNECARRMKAVDARIQVGAVTATVGGPEAPWNRVVLTGTRGRADFVIVHTYSVGLWGEPPKDLTGDRTVRGDRLMRAAMAAGEQLQAMLAGYRALIRECAGRDLPIALTEYNAMYVQEQPIPYRFTLGGALFSADYVRVLMQPQENIIVANYWQFCNGYWGLVQGPQEPGSPGQWRRMPAYYLFRLWAQHFGDTLVATDVAGPRLDFEGAVNVHPAHGDGGLPAGLAPGANLLDKAAPLETKGDGFTWRRTAPDALEMTLTALTKDQYPGIAVIRPVSPGTYRVSFEARASGGLAGGSFGLVLADLRGWEATHSAAVALGVESAADWRAFSVDYSPPPDCAAMALLWRLVAGKAPLAGTISVRNLRVTPVPGFPAYAALTASASLSADGRTLYLIVFNKHQAQDLPVRVSVDGFPAGAGRVWTVTGPSLEALNVKEEQVRETESGVPLPGLTAGGFSRTFPAHSMTAIELTRAE